MGTRGFVGFVVNGEEKIAYNHFDSYPGGLGLSVLQYLSALVDFDQFRSQVEELRVVSDDDPVTEEDITRLTPWSNFSVGGGYAEARPTWYQLLRETQGQIGSMLAAGMIEDGSEFPADSLFAEWGYIVDLDKGNLEVYRGFQQSPHNMGRFVNLPQPRHYSDSYYPCALAATWSLLSLPAEDEFLQALQEDEEE